jgi:RHS repeat-associated protein
MGYYYTSEPEAAPRVISCANPKTHTPGSPVKERGYHLTTSDDARTSRSATKYTRVYRKPHGGPKTNWVLSTKYTDSETGLLYYGHRYYQPQNGRWVSRDPIQEQGGILVHGFCHNNPVSMIDINGMAGACVTALGSGALLCGELFAGATLPVLGPWVLGTIAIGAAGTLIYQYTRTGTYSETWDCYKDTCSSCSKATSVSVPKTIAQTKTTTVPLPQYCKPCIPAAGSTCFRTDIGPGHGCPGPFHTHHFYVVQLPMPSCLCTKQTLGLPVTCGSTPWPGEIPWSGPVLGGGVGP